MIKEISSLMMTSDVIDSLLPKDNYQKFFDQKVFDKQSNKIEKHKIKHDDELFWLFYRLIFKDEFIDYNKSFQIEKNFKIELVSKLRDIKIKLKNYKLKLNDIENDLVNEKKISVKTFFALCLLYDINIIYIWDFKYFELLCNSEKEIFFIENNKNSEIKILENVSKDKIYDSYFYVENIDKSIKSISSYTKNDLTNICNKLNIRNFDKKNTKEQLYEKICLKINVL